MNNTPVYQDLSIPRKTSKLYELRFTKSGGRIDITDWIVFFTMKNNMSDPDAQAVISKTIKEFDNPSSGIATVSLTADDTDITPKSYYYDITVQDDEVPTNRIVVVRGRITIEKTTTLRDE